MAKWSTLFPSGPGNIDGLSTGIIVKTADGVTDTYANRTVTGTTNRIVVTNGNGVAGDPTIDIGSDVTTINNTQNLLNKKVSSTNAMTGGLSLPNGTTGERPGTPDVGMVRWNSTLVSLEIWNGTAWAGVSGSSSGSSSSITQTTHGFSVGNLIYHTGSAYAKAIATAATTSSVVGMVSAVADANNFTLTTSGLVTGLSGLTTGSDYFLDATTAGLATLTEPSVIGQVSLPIGIAASATSMYIDIKRGITVGGVNARTTVNLNNNSINTIQNASAWISGELTGWVTIAATTPLRFFVRAPFAKNGASTDYNISPSYVGDTVPVGFTTTITSGGLIQMTLPSITGYTSASVNFSVDAPAVGATFPLQISSNNITFQEPTMFRNRFINGNFDIWQRATSQTAAGYGSADRWLMDRLGTTGTMSRQTHTLGQTDVPNNPKYFMRHVVTSSAGAGNYYCFVQRIEGVSNFAGQTVTVSFYAKADAAKPISVEATQLFGTGGSPSAAVTDIVVKTTLSTSWVRYSIQLAIPSIAGKTLGTNGDDSLQMIFWLDAGSSLNSRTNTLGQQSGTFDISSVQMELGTIATPFEVRPIGTELALCRRYYYHLTSATANGTSFRFGSGLVTTSTAGQNVITLPVPMRTIPTISTTATAANYAVYNGAAITTCNATPTLDIAGCSPELVTINATVASGLTAGQSCCIIANSNNTAFLGFSAEL